jgi:hypothetical protein
MQGVMVNGTIHTDFDPPSETVRIPTPKGTLEIQVDYT